MSVISLSDYKPRPRYDGKAWKEARIEGAESSLGPWAEIQVFTLTPEDGDPSTPASRNFTTEEATPKQTWVRIVFIDGDGDEEATEALQVTPPWSYSGSPASSEKDAVRFEIPDTDESAQLIGDAEIEYTLEQEASVYGAAARCCESLSRKFAMQADIATGDIKLTYSKQAENLAERAKELRARAQGAHAPFAGGISRADKEGRVESEDRVQSAFSRGQFDNPAAGL